MFNQQVVKPVCCLLDVAGDRGELEEGRRVQRAWVGCLFCPVSCQQQHESRQAKIS